MGDEEHNMVQIVSNELGYAFQMPDGSQVLIRAESRPPEAAKAEEPYSEAAVTDAQEAEDSQHTLLLDPGSEIVSEHDAALAAVGETHPLEQAGRRRVAVVLSDQGVATAVPLHCVVEAGLSQRVLFQEDGQPVILEVLDQTETGVAQESEDDPGEGEPTPGAAGQSWLSGTERARAAERASDGRQMKTGMWSREEVETLSANMDQFCQDRGISNPEDIIFRCSKDERKNFYRTVAKGINRPLFAIYRRIIRMYDRKNHMGRYTEEEVEQLRNLRAIHGNKWGTIGALMGRSAASVKDRVRVLRDNCNQGKWLKEEEERLERAVYEVTDTQPGQQVTSGINWAAVAQKVQTRREKQCRSKWLNNLSWKSAGGQEWTRDDDQHLIETLLVSGLAEESEVDWASLTERWPRSSVRSPQWLRGRWWTLKQQLKQHHNLGFRELLGALAQMKPRGDGLLEPGQDVDGVELEEPPQEQQEQQEQPAEEQPQQQLQPMVPSPAPQAFLPPGARVFVDQDGHVLPPGSLAVPQEAAFVLEPPLPVAGYAGTAVVIGGHLYTALPPQPAAPLALVAPDRLVLEPAPAPAALLHHPGTQLPPHHESGVALVSATSLPEPDYSVDLVDEPLQEVHLESSHAAVIRGDPIMSRTAPGATSEDESIDCPQ